MPPPSNPPPSNEPGAISNPRMLNRWLDINPVHALERIKTYWSYPAFEIDDNWAGYSNLVGVFNYTATNNFTLTAFETLEDPNYIACVMWVDDDLNVFRYKLWENVGEVFNFSVPLYTGQLIKKNYRIEIWTIAPTGTLLTLTVNGGGTASVNTDYAYVTADSYTNSSKAITHIDAFSVWVIGQTPAIYYVIDENQFPFGLWSNTDFAVTGASPPPYLTTPVTVSSGTTQTFYTSVLGGYDYMWASDSSLATASSLVTDFSLNAVAGVFTPPIVPTDSDSIPTTN